MGRSVLLLLLLAACPTKSAAPARPADGTNSPAVTPSATAGARAPASGSAAPIPSQPVTAPVPPAPSGPASNATLAEVGLQATYLDRSVDPCVDFVQFACGGWLATSQIPADQPVWSTASEAAEKNRAALKALLEQATGKIGDYYAACTDEAAIEKAGIAPLKPLLDKSSKVKDPKSWLAALTAMHGVAIWAGFSVAVRPDAAGTNVVTLGLPRFWLGEPAAYLAPDRKELRDAYEQHVARMLVLAGTANPERAAADVFAIEIELAKLADAPQGPAASLRLEALAKQTKSIDWKAYAKALGIPPSTKLLVAAPRYFAGLDGVRKRFKPAQWAGYFTYHLVADMAFALPDAFGLLGLVSYLRVPTTVRPAVRSARSAIASQLAYRRSRAACCSCVPGVSRIRTTMPR